MRLPHKFGFYEKTVRHLKRTVAKCTAPTHTVLHLRHAQCSTMRMPSWYLTSLDLLQFFQEEDYFCHELLVVLQKRHGAGDPVVRHLLSVHTFHIGVALGAPKAHYASALFYPAWQIGTHASTLCRALLLFFSNPVTRASRQRKCICVSYAWLLSCI